MRLLRRSSTRAAFFLPPWHSECPGYREIARFREWDRRIQHLRLLVYVPSQVQSSGGYNVEDLKVSLVGLPMIRRARARAFRVNGRPADAAQCLRIVRGA